MSKNYLFVYFILYYFRCNILNIKPNNIILKQFDKYIDSEDYSLRALVLFLIYFIKKHSFRN